MICLNKTTVGLDKKRSPPHSVQRRFETRAVWNAGRGDIA